MPRTTEARSSGAPLRAVFFDLAGTLIRVRGSIGTQYSAVAREFGVDAEAASLDRGFPGAFAAAGRMVFPRPDAAEVASLEKGFWKEVVRQVFVRAGAFPRFGPGQFDAYFDRLFEYFATAAGWEVYQDVVPALDRLEARGSIVGLITNFDHRVFKLVDAVGLGQYMRSITIPGLAAAAKPERAIFEYALARHGLRPDEAVQVGDSVEDDIDGARAAGMRAVLLDRKGRQSRNDVPTIGSLEELPKVLGVGP